MIKILKFFLPFSIFYFLFSGAANAAELSLTSQTREIGVNQRFQVDLLLDTEDDEINAVGGKVAFPADLLELEGIRDGGSIINFWVKRPDKEREEVAFSGITPGGYFGNKGLVFSLIFEPKKEGEGTVALRDGKVLLNDGKGTSASLKISSFQFSISRQISIPVSPVPVLEIRDIDPPEEFKPEIGRDPDVFGGKWFLVFAAQDKGSGMDHYEVLESGNQETENRNWEIAESPYLLKDQKLRSFIYVKAVDRAGNERAVELPPTYPPAPWYEKYWIFGIIILGVFLFIIWHLWRRKLKHETTLI